jgi:hypothetical protein
MRTALRVCLCLGLSAATTAVWATTAVERTEGEMIDEAAIIVTGRCTHVESRWLDRDLVTVATVEVTEALKGAPPTTINVVLPGGIDANRPIPIAMTYPAAPEIYTQEDVLLFLTEEDRVADGYSIVGFSQGKFTLVEDAKGKKVGTQDLSRLNLVNRSGRTATGGGKTVSIEALRQKIQQLESAGKGR